MKQIAIIKVSSRETYCECGCDIKVADSITNWQEVSDEDYEVLRAMASKLNDSFIVISRPEQEGDFILKTVADYQKEALKYKKALEQEQKEKEEKAKTRAAKKGLREVAKKRKLLEELKKELEG